MAKLDFALLCERAIAGENKKLDLLGVFNEFTGGSIPARTKIFFLVIQVCLDNTREQLLRAEFLDPSGKKVRDNFEKVYRVDPEHKRMQVSLEMPPFDLKEEGEHPIRIYWNGEHIGEAVFTFKVHKSKEASKIWREKSANLE